MSMAEGRIATQIHHCGRYVFKATLPTVGPANEAPLWTAAIDGKELPARYFSLEDAMIDAATQGKPA